MLLELNFLLKYFKKVLETFRKHFSAQYSKISNFIRLPSLQLSANLEFIGYRDIVFLKISVKTYPFIPDRNRANF